MGEDLPATASFVVGDLVELTVGGPAHGGSCVARFPDGPGGRVVFVRHALPGERVRARVTDDRGRFALADAVEVLTVSADRVDPPCPHAGPGRCGGCDWQHASAPAQRTLKDTVIREQFARLADLSLDGLFGGVEPLPGGLLGWRTRTLYAVGADGRAGLRRHHSHEVERLEQCPLGVPGVGDADVLGERWTGLSGVEVVRGSDDATAVLTHRPGGRAGPDRGKRGERRRHRRPPDRVSLHDGPSRVAHEVDGRTFHVRAGGFWQVHPAAASTFAAALLAMIRPRPGERALDLYSGAGALTAPLAAAVGTSGHVISLEADAGAVEDARDNLADLPQVDPRCGPVTASAIEQLESSPDVVDLVVLDPPRTGAGREVMHALLASRPRTIGYVACDPAALARDVATAIGAGWRLTALRAFDAFPMTHHVECVARLDPPG